MIIKVIHASGTKYIDVPNMNHRFGLDRDKACEIAFLHVYGRRITNYNELVHHTEIIKTEDLTGEQTATYNQMLSKA